MLINWVAHSRCNFSGLSPFQQLGMLTRKKVSLDDESSNIEDNQEANEDARAIA